MAINSPQELVQRLRGQNKPKAIRAIANEALSQCAPDQQSRLMMIGSNTSPFFIPNTEPGSPGINLAQWLLAIGQARTAAANSAAEHILVAAPMKSGSTFVVRALAQAFSLQRKGLAMLTGSPYDFTLFGAGLQAFRIDELSLVTNCLAGPLIAHHHVVCSPLLAGQLEVYNLRPVLLKRNIFDCLVSLDEFYRKDNDATQSGDGLYFNSGMPPHWSGLDDETRMRAILDRYLQFYVDYYVSWTMCEKYGLTRPLWLSYESDILGDKERLAVKVCSYLGRPEPDVDKVVRALASFDKAENALFNKGVSGRGAVIQGRNRERVLEAFDMYRDYADWSGIVG